MMRDLFASGYHLVILKTQLTFATAAMFFSSKSAWCFPAPSSINAQVVCATTRTPTTKAAKKQISAAETLPFLMRSQTTCNAEAAQATPTKSQLRMMVALARGVSNVIVENFEWRIAMRGLIANLKYRAVGWKRLQRVCMSKSIVAEQGYSEKLRIRAFPALECASL
jgi:hypothetical protein